MTRCAANGTIPKEIQQLRWAAVMSNRGSGLKAEQKQVVALKRLIIAATTFDHVKLLCAHIESLGAETFTPLHVPLFAGVSVTYMKPFMRSDGLGPLPRKFQEFPDAVGHQKTHEDLKNGRDWYYAHRDMLKAPNLLSNPDKRAGFEDITLHVEESGISFSINEQAGRLPAFLAFEIFAITKNRESTRTWWHS